MSEAIDMRHHNNPPEATPFEISRDEIEALYEEAKHWLDGDDIVEHAVAEQVSKLMDEIRKAIKAADNRRKEEVKPLDDAKSKIQARYNELIGETKSVTGKGPMALDACKKALAPYLKKLDDEKRAIAEVARIVADRKREEAEAAIRASREADLAQREEAERLLRDAQQAETAARRAANDKAQAKGGSRATSLRTSYVAEVVDMTEFARFCWKNHHEELSQFFRTLAQRKVDAGTRSIPGVEVHEHRSVV
ncbi:hypothetical protein FPY71_07090 [Aureimonas fodinaquatilis]|uniref:Uncharacterized protein n=1 Tax=Aureimonas fodinaquatilis TaxID=2565783 RepID=A0A5B0DU50_9HYPH|nr:hypothetical protein [Aureimonas fodinaquatilis]KAA0970284.1 hypothetical protein FPY71_07090 [Aureimonas fodinaquatilis]